MVREPPRARRGAPRLRTGGSLDEISAGGALFLGLEELVQGLDGDLEFGAAGLRGCEVPLEEVADGDGRPRLAEDEPGLGDEDELEDGVAPPADERVEHGGEDDVAKDVRAAARMHAAASAPLRALPPRLLVGGYGLVLGPVVASDRGELHRSEKEEQDGQDRELGQESEDAAQGASSAPELHEAHEEPETGERGPEEDKDPEGADDLQEEPAPEKERADYGPAGDALDGWIPRLPDLRRLDADVDLTFRRYATLM